jgi:hypothetical protein
VDFRREMRPVAFVDPGAFLGPNPTRHRYRDGSVEFTRFRMAQGKGPDVSGSIDLDGTYQTYPGNPV